MSSDTGSREIQIPSPSRLRRQAVPSCTIHADPEGTSKVVKNLAPKKQTAETHRLWSCFTFNPFDHGSATQPAGRAAERMSDLWALLMEDVSGT
jgi:hypothetical protein